MVNLILTTTYEPFNDQVTVSVSAPSVTTDVALLTVAADTSAEVHISDEMLAVLPVVNRIHLLTLCLTALLDATTPETEIPMLVDTEFEIF